MTSGSGLERGGFVDLSVLSAASAVSAGVDVSHNGKGKGGLSSCPAADWSVDGSEKGSPASWFICGASKSGERGETGSAPPHDVFGIQCGQVSGRRYQPGGMNELTIADCDLHAKRRLIFVNCLQAARSAQRRERQMHR